jgi:hypothetical protein
MSAVEMGNSIYTLGGFAHPRALDTVQRLSLDSLAWELMQLKLLQAVLYFACINTDSQVYLLINESLYSFTPLEVRAIKSVPACKIWCDTSYYSKGSLYYSWRGK